MTDTLPQSAQTLLAHDRHYRISQARWLEEQRQLAATRGRLLRIALDDTSIATMSNLLRVNTARLYQIIQSRGYAPTRDFPATPEDAQVVVTSKLSHLTQDTTWGELRRSISPHLARVLRMAWHKDWERAYCDAGLDPQLVEDDFMKGPISRWWFHLAPQTIEDGLHVKVQ